MLNNKIIYSYHAQHYAQSLITKLKHCLLFWFCLHYNFFLMLKLHFFRSFWKKRLISKKVNKLFNATFFFFRHTNVFMCENNCILLFCVSAYMKIFSFLRRIKSLVRHKNHGKVVWIASENSNFFNYIVVKSCAFQLFFLLSRKLFSTFGEIQQRKKSIFYLFLMNFSYQARTLSLLRQLHLIWTKIGSHAHLKLHTPQFFRKGDQRPAICSH